MSPVTVGRDSVEPLHKTIDNVLCGRVSSVGKHTRLNTCNLQHLWIRHHTNNHEHEHEGGCPEHPHSSSSVNKRRAHSPSRAKDTEKNKSVNLLAALRHAVGQIALLQRGFTHMRA